jgi:hypothetical protein
MSAALAGVSLKVSRAFVEAAPAAAEVLSAEDLRHWGEFGRRLAMGSAVNGTKFFAAGVDELRAVPEASRPTVFQICTRQLVLSSSTALDTFKLIPTIAAAIADERLLADVLDLAADIAQRSAKHSAEFVEHTPAMAKALAAFGEDKSAVAASVVDLARQFVNRTGGMTADLWSGLPASLKKLDAAEAQLLMQRAVGFSSLAAALRCISYRRALT